MHLHIRVSQIFKALQKLGVVHKMLHTSWRPLLQTPLTRAQKNELMQKVDVPAHQLMQNLHNLQPLQLQYLTVYIALELAALNKKRVLH